jgi:hypothetical protein
MNFRDYYSKIESLLKEFSLITNFSVDFEEIEDYTGYIKGKFELLNGSILYFFEFIEIQNNIPVLVKYKYQWQSPDGDLLKRWDNAPHHRELNTFPDHVHDPNGVHSSSAMNLESILDYCINIE